MIDLFAQPWAVQVFVLLQTLTFSAVVGMFIDNRSSRRRMYERLEETRSETHSHIDELTEKLHKEVEAARGDLREHERSCGLRRAKDERWMGSVDEKLTHIERSIG